MIADVHDGAPRRSEKARGGANATNFLREDSDDSRDARAGA